MSTMACPSCRLQGKDRAGDNLTVYPDGHGYCHACGYWCKDHNNHKMITKVEFEKETNTVTMEEIKTYPFGAPHKPWLSQQAAELYEVRYSISTTTYKPDAVYYPYKEEGEIKRYKPRYLPKRFSSIGGDTESLFGEHLVGNSGLFIVVTEGEDDALAAYSMFLSLGKKYRVVSLADGANKPKSDGSVTLSRPILSRLSMLAKFKKVVLAFDNDVSGKAYAAALAEKLAPRTSVHILDFPDGIKDADDMCRAGRARDFMQLVNNAREFVPDGIVEISEMSLEYLQQESVLGYVLPYPRLQDKLKGLREGEITLFCAGTGIGKTTICRELGYHLVTNHNLKVGNIFLEEQFRKTGQGYIAIDNNVPLAQLRINKNAITQEQWIASHQRFISTGDTRYFKHFGSIASGRLIDKILYMRHALGMNFVILDHITLVISGQDTFNERKDIDILMTRLAELVVETGVGILPVVHLKRSTGSNGKSFNKGDEVELTDLRGSSQLEALSWNVIAMERDQQSMGKADISKLRLLKNREWGFTGLCDTMFYDHKTGRLKAL